MIRPNSLDALAVAERHFNERRARRLRRVLETAWPEAIDINQSAALVALTLDGGSIPVGLDDKSRLFAENIVSIAQGAASINNIFRSDNHRIAGLRHDVLGECDDINDWSLSRILNLLQLRQVQPSKRAAVVGTMRDDGIYALEWIAHYQALGFDRIILYTNDNADGSERLLRCLAVHDQIILVESETTGLVRPEVKAFDHALHFIPELRDCEWALFVDSDEFFVPDERFSNRISNVLDEIVETGKGKPPSAVLYPWLWYTSDMVFDRQPGLLMERFRHATPHWLTKALVRIHDIVTMRQQHVPELFLGGRIANSALKTIDPHTVWAPHAPAYGGGRINHYWPKSFQEFSLKKARGDRLPIEVDEYRRSFSLFFEWNAPDVPNTAVPPNDVFLAEVRQRRAALLDLDGVAAHVDEVETNFRSIVDQYQGKGALRSIYDTLRRTAEWGQLPSC